MKKVVVTGANGFVGSRFVKELINKGIEVLAIIRNEKSNIDTIAGLPKVRIVYCDLLDFQTLEEKIPDRDIDAFYHLAWAGVSADEKNDFTIQYENIRFTVNALTAANRLNCKLFIGTGTVAEYVYCDQPMNESFAPSPTDIYGAAKVSSKVFCKVIANQLGQSMIWTILPSIYGEGREDKNILTYAIQTFLRNEKPSFTKLEQMWDFLYIDDLVEALYLIGVKGKKGETYGIGSGVFRTMRYYVETIRDLINRDLPIGIGDIPYVDDRIPSSCVDISKLSADTEFSPTYTFQQGITRTIQWYKTRDQSR